ncbi:MAG: signal peptidase I [Planctomycetota bacterium]|jgi:signal peptidase I
MTDNTARRRLRTLWQNWIRPLLVVVVVIGGFRTAVADWHDVPTQSMEPTILAGDRIVVNRLAYDVKLPLVGWSMARHADPHRGDVVICSSPDDGTRLVKRVVGVPGDIVSLKRGRLHINGTPVDYEDADDSPGAGALSDPGPHQLGRERLDGRDHLVMFQPRRPRGRTLASITVPSDAYLVLGDNRDNSRDSRAFGFVARGEIKGKVVGVAFSLDKRNAYAPRWERTFDGIQ